MTRIITSCACGASFEVRTRWGQDAWDMVATWLRYHTPRCPVGTLGDAGKHRNLRRVSRLPLVDHALVDGGDTPRPPGLDAMVSNSREAEPHTTRRGPR